MKKTVMAICIVSIISFFCVACNMGTTIDKSYGEYELKNADSSIATIKIDSEKIYFENVDIENVKNTKVAFEVQKEIKRMEQSGETISENDKQVLKEKFENEIDWDDLSNEAIMYNAEYEEDTQTIYFETCTGREYELYLSYDLKYETITLYDQVYEKK